MKMALFDSILVAAAAFVSHPATLLTVHLVSFSSSAVAETIMVPKDHQTIQAAINAAHAGDTVLVAAGTYQERLRLTAHITLRSTGENTKGKLGLARTEATIIDGGGDNGDRPGVMMAEGSRLDGFTVTNVGIYDQTTWQKHFDSQGEDLRDDEGAAQSEGTIAAISVRGVHCTVTNNIIHHNGDVGISVSGGEGQRINPLITGNISYRNLGGGIGVADRAEAIIRSNRCFENLRAGIGCRNSSPLVVDNVCYSNIRAGIGCREKAAPVVRGNTCYQNRRAGIGIRMKGTAPIIEKNECYENHMAGIGTRDGATPIIRRNKCYKNKMAGIGCDGSQPLIVGNQCRENEMAGIGLRETTQTIIQDNICIENKLVAIGVTAGSTATIVGNRLVRTGGMPPVIAVRQGSTATIQNNKIEKGGVAGILVEGTATITGNTFEGVGEKQRTAVWVWQGSTVNVSSNSIDGYRSVVNAVNSVVVVTKNTVSRFRGPAIIVKDSTTPAHVYGNTAITTEEHAKAVQIQGLTGIVSNNQIKPPAKQE
ncbi:hypothetical protein KOR42_16980 [Thalassoglobus neptunius]|uniref:Right handed beta helix domain-containing protein n=1 Tax=Thalassoglobus neptunius TaxID=1938619 RepID=A0A5C5X5X6_9PLAN|nr:right-handed parallel beta-helix repeat-containing protein [Thalassoglobus neptunius]TWT58324.1 hypothetical protein KOR42_16980 [Thalassoglobus neptunius]